MKREKIIAMFLFALLFAGGCGMIGGNNSFYTGPDKSAAESGTDGAAVLDDGAIWVAPDGDDSGTGTIASPYKTVGQGVAAAVAASGAKEVHLVAGTYAETVIIGDATSYHGVRLLGGYGSFDSATGTRSRDTAVNITTLDRLVMDGSSGAPLNGSDCFVEGMTISNFTVKNASPTVTSNVISSESGTCRGGATLTLESSGANIMQPLISNNSVENIACTYSGDLSLVIAVEARALDQSSLSPRFESNAIVSGSLQPADMVLGLVAHAAKSASVAPSLTGNQLSAGAATLYSIAVNAWADTVDAVANLTMTGNDVRAGTAPLSNGVDLGYDSIHDIAASYNLASIENNKIAAGDGSSLVTALSIYNSAELSTVVNNFISGGVSRDAGAWLSGINLEFADANIVDNTIVADSGDIATLINLIAGNGSTTIANNTFYAGGAGTSFTGIFEQDVDSTPASVVSNLFDSGLHVVYTSFANGDILTVADLAAAYPVFDPNYSGDVVIP